MKKVKNYIQAELAKKKIARYKYWCIKDENGIVICDSADNNPEDKNFGEYLDKIIHDNVDVEVQIKYGTNEQSARHNPPFFVKINDSIEWVEPEGEDSVTINGVPHKVDKNGHVNINLNQPTPAVPMTSETIQEKSAEDYVQILRGEMDMQLSGLRKEYELKEQKWQADMNTKLLEQNVRFKEMMLSERETRLNEREQLLATQEALVEQKEKELEEGVKSYMKHIPSALGSIVKDFLQKPADKPLSGAKEKKEPSPIKRKAVEYDLVEPEQTPVVETQQTDDNDNYDDYLEEEDYYESLIEDTPIQQEKTNQEKKTSDDLQD